MCIRDRDNACFQKIELKGDRVLAITYSKDKVNAGEVLAAVQKDGYGIVDVVTREADLEDVFLNLTRASNSPLPLAGGVGGGPG